MKAATLLLVLTATVLGAAAQQVGTQDLRLRIEFEKSSYRSDEPIVCRVLIENVSDKYLTVNNRMLVNIATGPHELRFQILGPDKTSVPFVTKIRASFESDQFMLLPPSQVTGLLYDLRKDHPLTQRGTYTVRAYYENKNEAPAQVKLPPAWRGSLESNRASFSLE